MAEANLIRGEVKPTTRPFRANLVGPATKRDISALRTMFHQFCGENDEILTVDYLGLRGLWHIGMHSFICLTKSRICAIEVGWLGRVVYAEGYLEDFNSGHIIAPTLLP